MRQMPSACASALEDQLGDAIFALLQEKASTDFCLFKAKQLKGSLDAALSGELLLMMYSIYD